MSTKDKIKTLIVDDEIAFINTLELMLTPFESFEIIAKARNVADSIALINEMKPDLIFLDVQLEDGTGFDVLKNIDSLKFPKIIFVTAHDFYAVQAFKYSAIDYLLKPVLREDLIRAIKKVKRLILQENLDLKYNVLLENIQQKNNTHKKIVLKEQNTHHVIPVEDIVLCHAEGSYTLFHLEGNRKIVVSKHLKEFEEILPRNIFYRVHRSYLINTDKILKYERSEGGVLVLHGGRQIPVSVRKRQGLSDILSKF